MKETTNAISTIKDKSLHTEKIIFCDCFNTVIGRRKTPDDVLFDWGEQLSKTYPSISGVDFFRMFKKQWAIVNQINILELENSEFLTDITEIYRRMFLDIKKYNLIENIEESSFIKNAYDCYINAEHNSHFVKKHTIKYLQKCKDKNYKIYMVSDFYCESKVLENWLDMLNIDHKNLFEKIYVSSDCKKSKNTGSIYKYIIEENNFSPKQVTMIGDNIHADVHQARKQGLRARLIACPQIKLDNRKVLKSRHKLNVPEFYKNLFEQDVDKYGYYINYAFPLYTYIKRLYDRCEAKKVKNIFFLAREGDFLKKIFDEYAKFYHSDIKSHYLVISRASVLSTSMKPYDQMFIGLVDKPFIRPKNFLKTLHFTNEQIEHLAKSLKINVKRPAIKLKNSKRYKKIIESEEFNTIFNEIRASQRKNYTKYLNSFGVDLQNEGFYVADSGWLGNMQRYMRNYFDTPQPFEAFCIGTGFKKCVEEKVYGLLFAKKLKALSWQNKVFSYRNLNYEEVLRSENSTCLGYDDNGDPVLAPRTKENEAFKMIKPWQDKIFDKFIQIMEYDSKHYSDIYSISAYLNYQMIKKANKIDRKFFGEIQETFYDCFGYIGYSYALFSKFFRSLNFRIRDFNYVVTKRRAVNKRRKFWI